MVLPETKSRKRWKWALRIVLVTVLVPVVYVALWVAALAMDAGCKRGGLKRVYGLVLDNKTRLTNPKPDWMALTGEPTPPKCLSCWAPYVYKPLQGPAKTGGETGAESRLRMVSWCPRPWHLGHRNVLFETGLVVPVPEADFQRMAANGYVTTWVELEPAVNRTRFWLWFE